MTNPAPQSGLLLLRHSESTYNAEGRWAGWENCPLTPHGVARAHHIGERLAEEGRTFSAVQTSDLERARHGGEIIATHLDIPLLPVDARWRERNAGLWQGRLLTELQDDPKYIQWRRDSRQRIPSGESHRDFLYRLIDAMVDATRTSEKLNAPVIVVAHDGVQQALSQFLDHPGYPYGPLEGFWIQGHTPVRG